MIEVQDQCASFSTVMAMCKAADAGHDLAHCLVLGRHVFAAPGDNPHELYSVYFGDMTSNHPRLNSYLLRLAMNPAIANRHEIREMTTVRTPSLFCAKCGSSERGFREWLMPDGSMSGEYNYVCLTCGHEWDRGSDGTDDC